MMQKIRLTALSIFIATAALFIGCSLLPVGSTPRSQPTSPQNPVISTASPSMGVTLPPEQALTETARQNHLIVWLPPEFNPSGQPAGTLFESRVTDFEQNHPGMEVEIRIKEVDGAAGMLAALETTLEVAPGAAPSLALMLQTDLETAVMDGLLQSPPGLAEIMEQEDWYAYAREMGQVQNEYFGVPFAADAMILVVRSSGVQTEIQTWDQVLSATRPLLFPASDAQSLFTLNLYLSAGGKLFDEENHPFLDPGVLTQVLEFYKTASEEGTLASSSTDFSNYTQTWDAFNKRMSNQTICWLSDYLWLGRLDEHGSVIPALGSESVTLVSGWMWAVTDPYEERIETDLALLSTLIQPDFQAGWIESAGYLPVRPSSLEAWEQPRQMALLSQATISAVSQPGNEILNLFGPVLSEAVYNVITGAVQPAEAARLAAEKIN